MKKILRASLIILSVFFLLVLAYVIYCFSAYSRIGSGPVDIHTAAAASVSLRSGATENKSYTVCSWNIGFGAYENDYGFFMDGGKESWAWSKERLTANMESISEKLSELDADICLIQEVDYDSTRTYHVDEREFLSKELSSMNSSFTVNYDSPFLAYPLLRPHGISRAGLMTFSSASIEAAERVELPVEGGFMKFLDLDRCYSKQFIPVEAGADLILYNFHLSAYTSDGTIATEQLRLLTADMQSEYEKGNYCVAGGDFNKDLIPESADIFGKSDKEYSWAQPIPADMFEGSDISLKVPFDREDPVPSSRNADSAYHDGQYVLTIDGFLVSDNVEAVSCRVIDTGFRYSDHNPVIMDFRLR